MDTAGIRALTSQLADDLAWLEGHSRRQPDQNRQAGRLRLAGAQVRNILGPYLEDQPARPLHLAVVGGAGAGKSTVANMLSGAVVAEANPQAGFTRHPVAYVHTNGQATWPAHLGFLGSLERLTRPSPANLDADVYQLRRVTPAPDAASLLDNFVIWDCPDMTTWAASGYVSRLMEVAALADVIVYVASDERYNDEVPTQFLRLLLEAGKAVIVCLVKMREADAPKFVTHFQKEVLGQLQGHVVGVLTIPQLTPAQLADPVNQAVKFRIPLLNQVNVLGQPPEARKRSVQRAMDFLRASQEQLLGVARNDLAALDAWRRLVHDGMVEFDTRYRREFLSGEGFHRFDEALVRLLDLLELPGLGKVLSGALWVVRTPYRLLKGLFSKALRRPEGGHLPERPVFEGALTGWLDLLRKESARRSNSHPLWTHINKGFGTDLGDRARERFEQGFRSFQLSVAGEVDKTARGIYQDLEKHPVALNTLRGTKFALEIAAIVGTVASLGILSPLNIVLVPLAASITHQLVELFGKAYVDARREEARSRQMNLVTQYVSGPLAEWLTQWPSTGGSAYERLQLVLRRLPPAVEQLHSEVAAKLAKG